MVEVLEVKMIDRVLGMELAGFDPLEFFTSDQVELMRSMKPKIQAGYRKCKFGILSEMCVDTATRNEMNRRRNV